MKILKLEFQNLNSLKGKWTIDFTDPAFQRDGLFAITGPTGAGKTTILDAICLSLYGKTPRLSSISVSSNEIMNRTSAVCFAQTTFSTEKGTFRSSFHQRYARGTRAGNLLAPTYELADAQTNDVLASSKKQFQEKIVETIGLTYDQFTRAVLLAQGQFKIFLDSNPNDRAQLLETITGAQIYTNISKKIYERAGQESQKLKEFAQLLDEINKFVLTESEQQELKDRIAEIDVQSQQYLDEIKKLEEQIQWVKELEKLQRELKVHEEKLSQVVRDLQSFQPQRERLALDSKAQKLYPDYQNLKYKKDALNKLNAQIEQTDANIGILKADIIRTDNELEQASQSLGAAQKELEDKTPVIAQVKELDVIIAQKQNDLAPLKTRLAEIQNRFNEACRKAKIAPEETPKELDSAGIELQIDKYLNGISISDAHNLIRKFDALKQKWTDLLSVKQTLLENQTALHNREQENQAYESTIQKLEVQKQDLETRTEQEEARAQNIQTKIDNAKLIQSLDQRRQNLQDQTPCPLCGALSHPYCEGKLSITLCEDEKEINAVQNSLLNLKKSLKQTGEELVRRQTEQKNVLLAIVQLKGSVQANQTRADDLCRCQIQCDDDISIGEIRNRIQALEQKTAAVHSRLQQAEQLDKLKEPVLIRDELTNAQQDLTQKMDVINDWRQKRQALIGDANPDKMANALAQAVNRAEKLTQAHKEKKLELQTKLESEMQKKDSLSDAQRQSTNELNDLSADFNAKLQKENFSSDVEYFTAILDDNLRNRLQQQEKELDNQKTSLETLYNTAVQKERQTRQQNLTDKPLPELVAASKETSAQREALISQKGSCVQRLSENERLHAQRQTRQKEYDDQRQIASRWERLNNLIGSKQGDKYRKIVQRLSLEILIDYANQQMSVLAPRYQLTLQRESDEEFGITQSASLKSSQLATRNSQLPKDDLAIFCLDAWQGGAIRPTTNLSGGESFLVSLALALGLSRMSSQNMTLETLFLDEGFGALDDATLQTALDAINRFQYERQANKLIGIISHVDALKERIVNKIEVVRSTNGTSLLRGAGDRNEKTISD